MRPDQSHGWLKVERHTSEELRSCLTRKEGSGEGREWVVVTKGEIKQKPLLPYLYYQREGALLGTRTISHYITTPIDSVHGQFHITSYIPLMSR